MRDHEAMHRARFRTGLLALVIVVGGALIGWFRPNPFDSPYELQAEFSQVSNLGERSPVRIAGVEVGKVSKVEPRQAGGARVSIELNDKALPIHEDAELKIRPRIFFEGNFFVDLRPGTPSAPELDDGAVVPSTQTAAPVQIGDVLGALQSDTRQDLQTLLGETSAGLGGGAAEALNRGAPFAGPALRDLAVSAEAALGKVPSEDIGRGLRGTRRVAAAFARDERALKELVTDLDVVAGALAKEDSALSASVPALRDTLRTTRPALAALNGALPPLRSLAREARPGVESLGPTLEAVLPLAIETRALVAPGELGAATRALRAATPSLVRLLRVSVPLFREGRTASACTDEVLVPFIESDFPDPDFPTNTGTVNEKLQRSFIGLAGESRPYDANQSYFHASVVPPALQVRPAPPADTNTPPPHRPDVPCETQEPPNLEAPAGRVSSGNGDVSPLDPLAPLLSDAPSLPVRRQALLKAQPLVSDWFKRIEARRARLLDEEVRP